VQNVAWNAIGRRAIMHDPDWAEGNYYDAEPPTNGLAVARMIGHITYLCEPALAAKCPRPVGPLYTLAQEFAIEGYLEHQGDLFNARFDANSYLYITKAIDYWDLPARYGSLDAALARSQCAFLVLAYSSDQLYTVADSRAIVASLRHLDRPMRYAELDTNAGHDAFLVESAPQAAIVARFLTTAKTV
jgi:homoserine O-acetyltransferase